MARMTGGVQPVQGMSKLEPQLLFSILSYNVYNGNEQVGEQIK